ncbi:hypothetical protein LJR078_001023 [Arthrobacter sp. LjRoot78]|uniref:hypothetical protein n=1 Tax=Arthrobacter sp. LjRoot78 TaxID=3342338 RepID=UPI003ED0922A
MQHDAGPEHAQDAESEVPGMVQLRSRSFPSCALLGKLAEGYVTAVAVPHVRRPSAKISFGTIGFANVLFAVGGVCDEVNPLDR